MDASFQRLAGKSIVIVGGTSGLGRSAARACARAGAKLILVGRESSTTPPDMEDFLGQAEVIFGEAMEPATAARSIERAVDRYGKLDAFYHVAGGSGRQFGDGPLHEITDGGWDYTLRENLTSLFYSNRAAVRQFLKQGRGGCVLNMSSVLGFSPSPRFFSTQAYAAAKAAIIGLTRSSAAQYAKDGIRFNALAPALVATPMSQRAQDDRAILDFIRTKQPLEGGRMGTTSDLDAAVVYFLSDDSQYVTGQVLAVDGGWSVSEGQYQG